MAKTDKLDLYKEHREEYVAKKAPVLVTVGAGQYLTIRGRGEPGGEAFQAKLGALYAAAFTIKMTRKFAGQDYKVCHLEGLWWGQDEAAGFFNQPKAEGCWKLLIRVPDFLTSDDLNDAKDKLLAKGKGPEVNAVELETIEEGRCVQMLHLGPYDAEANTIQAMRRFAAEAGLTFHGRHHEIYLSDPRRVPPERLRTILRMPVRKPDR